MDKRECVWRPGSAGAGWGGAHLPVLGPAPTGLCAAGTAPCLAKKYLHRHEWATPAPLPGILQAVRGCPSAGSQALEGRRLVQAPGPVQLGGLSPACGGVIYPGVSLLSRQGCRRLWRSPESHGAFPCPPVAGDPPALLGRPRTPCLGGAVPGFDHCLGRSSQPPRPSFDCPGLEPAVLSSTLAGQLVDTFRKLVKAACSASAPTPRGPPACSLPLLQGGVAET